MKWGLVCKPNIDHVFDETVRIHEYLESKGETIQLEERLAEQLEQDGTPLPEMDADLYVTVGGDGTILLTLEHTEKPVLAVNAGGVGFLTEVEPKYAPSAIDRILSGDYAVEERTRLAAFLGRERLPDAINEVTVQTAKIAKLIKFRLRVDDEVVDTIRGDGVIVATSTGSTGYAMSVGGPIIHPRVDAVVVAPIAPFRLSARPLVVPYDSVVEVTLLERKSGKDDKGAKVVIDGQHGYGLPYDGTVTMKPSPRRSRFVRFQENFYGRVRTKLIR